MIDKNIIQKKTKMIMNSDQRATSYMPILGEKGKRIRSLTIKNYDIAIEKKKKLRRKDRKKKSWISRIEITKKKKLMPITPK